MEAVLRKVLRRVGWVAAAVAGLALVYVLANLLQRLVHLMIVRLGALPTLVLVGAATVVLGLVWVRYGGARVLRRWGLVLKPARPQPRDADPGSGSERRRPLVPRE